MHSLFKSTLQYAFVVGFMATCAGSAQAQSANFLPSGSIQMGTNGPVATFSGPSILGNSNNGFAGSTQNSGFGFSPVDTGSRALGAPMGPQGQRGQGYGYGAGSSGSAMSSQGATGDQSRESITTQGNYYGNNQGTGQQQRWIRGSRNKQETNILSQSSVFSQPVPSASFNLGFQGGAQGFGGVVRGLGRGWVLPPTSTASVDLDIVDK